MKTFKTTVNPTRRRVLKNGIASAGIASSPLFFTRHAFGAEFTNQPKNGVVKLGFAVAQSGAFADEGADQLRGFKLAVEHLNGEGDAGMLNTMQPSALQGNGILGQRVAFVTADTQTRSSVASGVATSLIKDSGVSMISGGSSSGVAITMQNVCAENEIIFMASQAHSNDVTGIDRNRYGFRYYLNAQMSGTALSSTLVDNLGADRSAYYLSADYSWGYVNELAIRAATEAQGWNTVDAIKTPVGAGDFNTYLNEVISSGADTLILSHYGKDLQNSLTQAQALGLKDLQVNGNNFVIATPLFTDLVAEATGDACSDVYGTMNWHASLQDAASVAFVSSFSTKYDLPPSSAAHTSYVQTLLYADACERAGTFEPCQVIAELEGHQFNGLGNGNTLYRGADHQCFKDVLVVKGRENAAAKYDELEITNTVPSVEIEYSDNSPLFTGTLGACKGNASLTTDTQLKSDVGAAGSADGEGGGGGIGMTTAVGLAGLAVAKLSR